MTFQAFLESDACVRLGWTLLHSLWQLAIIGALAATTIACLRSRTHARYAVAYLALLLMAVAPVATYFVVTPPATPLEVADVASETPPIALTPPEPRVQPVEPSIVEMEVDVAPNGSPLSPAPLEMRELPRESETLAPPPIEVVDFSPAPEPEPTATTERANEPAPPSLAQRAARASAWLAPFWLTGVILLALRHLGGWVLSRRLLCTAAPLEHIELHRRLEGLIQKMGVRRAVRPLQSTLADVPMILGVMRPALIAPVSLVTGLSPTQWEAILAHELAHIRRHDYLMNLVQIVIETLLFYHPAAWWLSRRIRAERENCCDDIAAEYCGSPVALAEGLATIEAARLMNGATGPAVAAVGPGSQDSTLRRVRRILGFSDANPKRDRTWLAGLLVLTLLIIAGVVGHRAGAQADGSPQDTQADGEEDVVETPDDPLPLEEDESDWGDGQVSVVMKRPVARLIAKARLESGGPSAPTKIQLWPEVDHAIRFPQPGRGVIDIYENRPEYVYRITAEGYVPMTHKMLLKDVLEPSYYPITTPDGNIEYRGSRRPIGDSDSAIAATPIPSPWRARSIGNDGLRVAASFAPVCLTPSGETAVDADVCVQGYGKFGNNYRKPIVNNGHADSAFGTDEQGRAIIPAYIANAGMTDRPAGGIVILHDSGYKILTRAEFAAADRITLDPWGRITGQYSVDGEPGEGQELWLTAEPHADETIRDLFRAKDYETTDAEARFTFERLLPGTYHVAGPDETQTIEVRPGESVTLNFEIASESESTSPTQRTIPFELDKEFPLGITSGACGDEGIARLAWVMLGNEEAQLTATVRLLLLSAPKGKWRVTTELLSEDDKAEPLAVDRAVFENSGEILGEPLLGNRDLRFSLGTTDPLDQATRLRVTIEQVPTDTETTGHMREAEEMPYVYRVRRATTDNFLEALFANRDSAGMKKTTRASLIYGLFRVRDSFDDRAGPFERVLSYRMARTEHGAHMEARCKWEKAVMLVRLTFDEEGEQVTGFWLARDKEGPTPKGSNGVDTSLGVP